MQFNDLTYASSVHYINDKAVPIVKSTLGSEWSFFSAHAPLTPYVGLVGMKAALDDAPSLWSNPIVKVGSKE